MLKHIVMWQFKDFAEGKTKQENIQIFKRGLESLPPIISQIVSMQVGVNAIESDMSYDLALVAEFKNAEDLNTYKNHPEHKKVAAFCKLVRTNRVVIDFYENK